MDDAEMAARMVRDTPPWTYLGAPNCQIGSDAAWQFDVDGEPYRMGVDQRDRWTVIVRVRTLEARRVSQKEMAQHRLSIETRASLDTLVRFVFHDEPVPEPPPPENLHPLALEVLSVLRDLSTGEARDHHTLPVIYNIERQCAAPLDEAVYAWIDAGCPLTSAPPGQESS